MINSSKVYNNADSFSMVFDEAWKSNDFEKEEVNNKVDKLEKVLDSIKDHPFLQNCPSEARKVAQFRIRLLNLK